MDDDELMMGAEQQHPVGHGDTEVSRVRISREEEGDTRPLAFSL